MPSRLNNKPYQISALVAPRITIDLPVDKMDTSNWHHIRGVQLAGLTFHLPGKIDLLIGAELFYEIVQDGKQFGPEGAPILQNLKFVWIVAGRSNNSTKTDPTPTTTSIFTYCTTYQKLVKPTEESPTIFLPHHHVSRPSSVTTKRICHRVHWKVIERYAI